MTTTHEHFIRQSYALARQAREEGNSAFGAILVDESGQVLMTAKNTAKTDRDVTRHAELNLVSAACRKLGKSSLSKTILYASTEPCAMCAGAICWTGIPQVVFGCSLEAYNRATGASLGSHYREVFAKANSLVEAIGPILEEEGIRVHQELPS